LIKKLFCESQFSGFNQFLIDVSDLNPGIYFCHIITSNENMSQKIIVNRNLPLE